MTFEFIHWRIRHLLIAIFLVGGVTACAHSPEFETAPLMPKNMLPVVDSNLRNGVEITFSWTEVALAVDYEFHVFDRSSGALLNQRAGINPSIACAESVCTLTETLDLPPMRRHAWRVRAVNPAGQSMWSRSVFNIVQ